MISVLSNEQLLSGIDAFLERHQMAPTRLGSEATGEPQLVSTIRAGRSPSLQVLQRLQAYMQRKEAERSAEDHDAGDTGKRCSASRGNSSNVTAQVPA